MRHLKFRQWQKVTKHYVYFSLSNGVSLKFNIEPDLEQYTGLKDKNGKEIYEGDILSAFGNYYNVVFENVRAGFVAKRIDGSKDDYFAGYFGKYLVNHCEVIGNMHENPELLGHKG